MKYWRLMTLTLTMEENNFKGKTKIVGASSSFLLLVHSYTAVLTYRWISGFKCHEVDGIDRMVSWSVVLRPHPQMGITWWWPQQRVSSWRGTRKDLLQNEQILPFGQDDTMKVWKERKYILVRVERVIFNRVNKKQLQQRDWCIPFSVLSISLPTGRQAFSLFPFSILLSPFSLPTGRQAFSVFLKNNVCNARVFGRQLHFFVFPGGLYTACIFPAGECELPAPFGVVSLRPGCVPGICDFKLPTSLQLQR